MKKVEKNTNVNILYLTTDCNFDCSYCYENLKNKVKRKMSRAEIMGAIDNAIKSEPADKQTLFVLFGGEATLAWDEAKFAMNYAMSKKKNVTFNLETNGYRFKSSKFIADYINTPAYRAKKLTLDISFDGIGNEERKLKSGKSVTKDLLTIFKNLRILKIPFRVRYTVHPKNVNFLVQDFEAIDKTIHPGRIIVSIAYELLQDGDEKKIEESKNIILKKFSHHEITASICNWVCECCDGCTCMKEFNSYYSYEGNINKIRFTESSGKFNHFKEK